MRITFIFLYLAACSEYELTGEPDPVCTGTDGEQWVIGPEVCDGFDNDCDGAIDEGFDNDADGTADCFDTETCDGLDNDGDGAIDEDFPPDADSDGRGDCEVCNGADDDGDGLVDEGFDSDADGTADCDEVEVCDGADNNGDGDIDEGFPDPDGDGIANCETCNGVDDNGDSDIDEGFDLDGDGVARCCTPGEYVVYYPGLTGAPYTSAQGRLSNGDGTFEAAAPLHFLDSSGQDMRVLAMGEVDEVTSQGDQDLLWMRVSDRATFTTTCLDGEWQTLQAGTLDARGPSGWGDFDADGCLDYVAYDYRAGSFGQHGDSGDGFTYLGNCDGTFTLVSGSTFDVRFLSGQWTGGMPYNLADWNGDDKVDLFFWAVASGGTSPSQLWYLPGDGAGAFGAPVSVPQLNQAGNSGAMGDVDGDGCVDWVNGANDDGLSGSVYVVRGDCHGGSLGSRLLVNQGTYASFNSQGTYGDGASRLWDFDSDGDLDLITSFNRTSGGQAAILYWDNDGAGNFTNGTHSDPAQVLVPMWDIYSAAFLVPLDD